MSNDEPLRRSKLKEESKKKVSAAATGWTETTSLDIPSSAKNSKVSLPLDGMG